MRPRLAAVLAVVLVTTSVRGAQAQTPNERVLAESLFRDGKALMASGDVAGACRKLEESYRLDPVGGTLLNLATCHDKEGKVATAWAEYQSALELAKRANRRDRVTLAQKKVDELAKMVARITIQVTGEPPAGLVVELDGVALGMGSMGAGLAVDPGAHRIVARADGRESFESSVTVAGGESTTMAIPPLVVKERPLPVEVAPASALDTSRSWMRPTSYVLGGISIVGLAIGAGAGIAALGDASDADAGCRDGLCNAAGLAAHDAGRDAATVSNIGFVLGLLAGAGAVTFYVVSSDASAAPAEAPEARARRRRTVASVTPIAGPGVVGGAVRVPLP